MIAAFGLMLVSLDRSPFEVKLEDGTLVRLVSVTDSLKERAWKPSGEPAERMILEDPDLLMESPAIPGEPPPVSVEKYFLISVEPARTPHTPRKASRDWEPSVEVEGTESDFLLQANSTPFGPKRWMVIRTVTPALDAKTFDLDLKVADSRWRTEKVVRYRHGKAIGRHGFAADVTKQREMFRPKGALGEGGGENVGFPMVLPVQPGYEQLASAYEKDGTELMLGAYISGPMIVPPPSLKGRNGWFLFRFFIGDLNRVTKLKLRARPWKKVHFHGIHLVPNQKTEVPADNPIKKV